MIKLNDYLYNGDTVMKILKLYSGDLEKSARASDNEIDLIHSEFLNRLESLLEHNDFLTDQSHRIHDFYRYMTEAYPSLAFIFKGRIKSLIRAEKKFNGYIVKHGYDYYEKHGRFPDAASFRSQVDHFRDLIAYRIVISAPKCNIPQGMNQQEEEIRILYELAEKLPGFLRERGFSPEMYEGEAETCTRLSRETRVYYKDFVEHPTENGYQSLHITFYDELAKCYVELQLRTKDMDDHAEIGGANHFGYEKMQEKERARREQIPIGENRYFDDAYERGIALQELKLSDIDVNMFRAIDNYLVNDCCGLFRGRLILPFEHLSRFQND